MGEQSSNKRGVASTSEKEASSRHGFNPHPATSPVPGAFGKEGGAEREGNIPPQAAPEGTRGNKPNESKPSSEREAD